MAYTASTLLLALMLVATASVVHCTIPFNGQTVVGVIVQGGVTCRIDGTGAPGVEVSSSLDGGKTTVASGVTGECGDITLNIPVNVQNTVDYVKSGNLITANVPAGTCSASSPAEVLTTMATLSGTTASSGGVTLIYTFNINA